MRNRSGLSQGDRNRNARLVRLRELVPHGNAIVGIDLADYTQAAVVTDHDSRVIARRRASEAGFASVTVACEPTGHRWRVLDQLAAGRGWHWCACSRCWACRAQEGEDLTPGQVRSQGRGADRAAGQ